MPLKSTIFSHSILANISYPHLHSNSTPESCAVGRDSHNSKMQLVQRAVREPVSWMSCSAPGCSMCQQVQEGDRQRGHPWAVARTRRPEWLLSCFLGPWGRTSIGEHCLLLWGFGLQTHCGLCVNLARGNVMSGLLRIGRPQWHGWCSSPYTAGSPLVILV